MMADHSGHEATITVAGHETIVTVAWVRDNSNGQWSGLETMVAVALVRNNNGSGALTIKFLGTCMFDQMLTHLLSIESNIEAATCEFEENIILRWVACRDEIFTRKFWTLTRA
ncbi:hypothetical protein Tco_0796325 [Tanacetum coccineum]